MIDYKIGDVLYTTGGYNCTIVEFYKVVARTAKTLTVQPIESKVVDGDPMRTYRVVADETKVRTKCYTKSNKGGIVLSDSEPFKVFINRSGYAVLSERFVTAGGNVLYIWDGTPEWANTGFAG